MLSIPDLLDQALRVSGEPTRKAAVTRALQEFIANREQRRIAELFGTLEWDTSFDCKAERESPTVNLLVDTSVWSLALRRDAETSRARGRCASGRPAGCGTGLHDRARLPGIAACQPTATHTGAWSLGRSFFLGALSISHAVTRLFKASPTRMWSMRSPWLRLKAIIR